MTNTKTGDKPAKTAAAADHDDVTDAIIEEPAIGDTVLVLYGGKVRPGIVTDLHTINDLEHGSGLALDVYTFSVVHAAVPLSAITWYPLEEQAREAHVGADHGVAIAYPRT